MLENKHDDLLDVPFTFQERKIPLACKLRPAWRIYILLLILDKCHGGKASLIQLHVLNWAVRNSDTRREFREFFEGKRTPSQTVVRHDPSLNRAVHFAFAEGLVTRQEGLSQQNEQGSRIPPYRVQLSQEGRKLVNDLKKFVGCFEEQKRFFETIKGKISQKDVEMLFAWGD